MTVTGPPSHLPADQASTQPSDPLAHLTPDQKRALLLRLLQEKEVAAAAAPAVPTRAALPTVTPDPAHAHAPFPLTDIQHAYWLGRTKGLELGGVGAHVYSEFDLTITDRAMTDVGRMARAWQQVVARHAQLRIVVQPDGLQRVLEQVPDVEIVETDLTGLTAAESEARLSAHRADMQARVYDPAVWPMFDLRALRLASGVTRVCVSFDMLLLDLRSFQLVLEDWLVYYNNPDAALPPLPITFREYCQAEATLEGSELRATSKAYWTARLPELPPAPELPRPRTLDSVSQDSPEGRTFSRRSARLEPQEWQALKMLANQHGVTPASVLLGAFGTVLAGWSGSRRFTLNLTVFNRLPLHAAVPRLVGDFTGTTLLAFDFKPTEAFSARAARLQSQLWADLEHRYYSGVQVMRDITRETGVRHALCPVVFTSHLAGGHSAQDTIPPPLPVQVVYGLSQTPQVNLDYQVFEQGGGLNISWDARAALFAPSVLDEMFAANLRLLHDLASGAAWTATHHPLAPAHQLAARATGPAPGFEHNPHRSPATLPGLFESRAAVQPSAPALIAGDQVWTYGQLDTLTAAWAQALRAAGVGAGQPVALVMEHGWEGAAAALAVMRAGGAYLPIDPDQPHERILNVLHSSGAQLALTQPHVLARWPAPPGLTVWPFTDSPPPAAKVPLPTVLPTDLAYIIYTSGSTGQPKGVMIDHRGSVTTVLDVNHRFAIGPADRVLGVSALTFDLSVYDLFGTFAAGAALVLPTHTGRRDPDHWRHLIGTHSVTVWNSVPALLTMLLENGLIGSDGSSDLASLRLLLLSGDWIPLGLLPTVQKHLPQAQLISLGGATEASIWSILHEVDRPDPGWASVPYGRAMSYQTVQVLDSALNPAPDLAPGELFIGGVGVALGYWQDAERSASRFFVHPRTGERLYRTGDLGRVLPGGTLELLGRVDRQVKLRGHRIELGEVEAAIRAVPGVRDTLVTVRPGPAGQPTLTAYLIPDAMPEVAGPDSLVAELLQAADTLRPYQSGNAELDAELKLLTTLEARAAFKQQSSVSRFESGPTFPLTSPAGPHLERLRARRSFRRYALEPLPAPVFGAWLGALLPDPLTGRRRYASAGDLYPLSAYVWARAGRIEGLNAGLHVLDTASGCLRAVPDAPPLPRAAYHPLINRPMFDEAAFALFLVADLRTIAPVYGDRSIHFCTLEAGLMTGLLELQAASTALGVCQVGELNDSAVARALCLGAAQRPIHSLVGGLLEPDRMAATRAASIADLRPEARFARLLHRVTAASGPEEGLP
ncbi:amino acid adenylation domain-containing protein [Deinococcus sp. QL22]|uniref:non-ribosomal peptide synthetase n=1 Tax=Deinococcus sp. QL22 TaxID=2939437 RepID=UPI0020170710|nr:amino acid adenylation domain-containing protein [Deinococcus sp. QL22]UQN09206.1 amino acid adenylation domain-containing protein [Deinococcus sp. QL22]